MTFARIVDGVVVDVVHGNPEEFYHPDLAADFVTAPEAIVVGAQLIGGVWTPPANPDPAPVRIPVQLALIDFLRLLKGEELAGFNALRKICTALDETDYAQAKAGDPLKLALVGFEVFLTYYDALRAGLIELNHPETIQGLSVLVPLGVLTARRLADVLAGREPS